MRNILILNMVAVMFFSCGQSKKESDRTEKQTFEKGKITESVVCEANKLYSYAVYLPYSFDESKKYPLILVFDPHAKGAKAVELFIKGAEKYGYIIAGSNNIQNGVPWETSSSIYDATLTDILTRFQVDRMRIYTAGFSGGSRVASSIAIVKGGISAVIGCSGGFPQMDQPITNKFDFFGFAGKDDMNMAEMLNLDMSLEENKLRHQLVIFDGKHEWPPDSLLCEAFVFIEAMAMKDGKKNKDEEFISDESGSLIENIQMATASYEKYLLIKKLLMYFDGLTDLKNYKEELQNLEKNSIVGSKLKDQEYLLRKELMLQSEYGRLLQEKDAAWWQIETDKMNRLAKTSSDENERHMIKRVLAYLSLASYSLTNNLIMHKRMSEAERFAELYGIIDPENSEAFYMMAIIQSSKGEKDKAINLLDKASDLGFNDVSRVQNDTVFNRLRQEKEYFDVIEKIKKNN